MAIIEQELGPRVPAPKGVHLTRPSARRLGGWLATAGWASMAVMWITGSAEVFGHDQHGVPPVVAIGLFLVGWTVMVAAMMLPSSLPTLGRIDQALAPPSGATAPRFMAGYFLAWTVFGATAFAGDGILHLFVAGTPWLAARPWLIAGGIAMFAGAAELLGRTPPPAFPRRPRGAGPFALGRAHAVDRIRRCWPLMLFAMAVGMSSPIWMVGLTLVMALELRPRASAALRFAGLAVFGLGVAVVLEPNWAPVLLGAG